MNVIFERDEAGKVYRAYIKFGGYAPENVVLARRLGAKWDPLRRAWFLEGRDLVKQRDFLNLKLEEIRLPVLCRIIFNEHKVYFKTVYDPKFNELFKENGLKFDWESKCWVMNMNSILDCEKVDNLIAKITDLVGDEGRVDFENPHIFHKLKEDYKKTLELSCEANRTSIDPPAPDGHEYRPYQKVAVEFICKKRNVILGDEVGMGKTIEICGYLNLYPELRPVLFVTLKEYLATGALEFDKWLLKNKRVCVIMSSVPQRLREMFPQIKFTTTNGELPSADIYLINYQLLHKFADIKKERRGKKLKVVDIELKPFLKDLKLLILDESHNIKNPKAQVTKIVQLIKQKYNPQIIAASASPSLNAPWELWTTLNLLDPKRFPSFWAFAKRYSGAYQDRWGWHYDGVPQNLDELNAILRSNYMIRRRKEDVQKELPPVQRQILLVEGDEIEKSYEEEVFRAVELKKPLAIEHALDRYNYATGERKIPALISCLLYTSPSPRD